MSQKLKINIDNYPEIREFMSKLNDPKNGLKIGDTINDNRFEVKYKGGQNFDFVIPSKTFLPKLFDSEKIGTSEPKIKCKLGSSKTNNILRFMDREMNPENYEGDISELVGDSDEEDSDGEDSDDDIPELIEENNDGDSDNDIPELIRYSKKLEYGVNEEFIKTFEKFDDYIMNFMKRKTDNVLNIKP